jgi:hypothetical protein
MTYLLFALLLSSCSTLKDEECQNRDWHQQGLFDGQKGYSKEMYTTYLKVCEQQESSQSKEAYLKGYLQGTKRYCTYNKGLLVGESGRPYPDACPSDNYPQFSQGYKKGKKKALK